MLVLRRRFITLLTAGLSCGAFAAASVADSDDYRLGRGDRLELTVVGLPDMNQKVQIDQSGAAALPLLGAVQVAGLTLPEAIAKVREALSSKVVYRRNLDGKKAPYIIESDEVLLSVAEYRPIYVSGDVPRAGEQTFRPGMRVRHALSLAGGQEFMLQRAGLGVLNVFDYQGARQTLLLEYAQEQARRWRVAAEINAKASPNTDELRKVTPQTPAAQQIANLEAERYTLRMTDWNKERAFLSAAVVQADRRTKALSDQFVAETRGSTDDTDEYNRMRQLLDKNLTSTNRVTEARRAMLISATRALQIGVQLTLAERDAEDRRRMLQRTVDQRQVELTQELQTSEARLAEIRARIAANEAKLTFVGGAGRTLVGGAAPKRQIRIWRESGEATKALDVDENALLAPADVIEVTVAPDDALTKILD